MVRSRWWDLSRKEPGETARGQHRARCPGLLVVRVASAQDGSAACLLSASRPCSPPLPSRTLLCGQVRTSPTSVTRPRCTPRGKGTRLSTPLTSSALWSESLPVRGHVLSGAGSRQAPGRRGAGGAAQVRLTRDRRGQRRAAGQGNSGDVFLSRVALSFKGPVGRPRAETLLRQTRGHTPSVSGAQPLCRRRCLGVDLPGTIRVAGPQVSRELCSAAWPVCAQGSDTRGLGGGAGDLPGHLNCRCSRWGPWAAVRRAGLKQSLLKCLVLERVQFKTPEGFKEGNDPLPEKYEKRRPCTWWGALRHELSLQRARPCHSR